MKKYLSANFIEKNYILLALCSLKNIREKILCCAAKRKKNWYTRTATKPYHWCLLLHVCSNYMMNLNWRQK